MHLSSPCVVPSRAHAVGFSFRFLAVQLLAKDIVDPALRAFAVTNLDKDPATGGWAWRVNIDVILRSMGTLAQFESGRRHREDTQGRLLGGGGDEDELGSYGGDVSARVWISVSHVRSGAGTCFKDPIKAGVTRKRLPSPRKLCFVYVLRCCFLSFQTLFVAGGNSRYIRSQHLQEIGKLFPKFVVSTIKGAG